MLKTTSASGNGISEGVKDGDVTFCVHLEDRGCPCLLQCWQVVSVTACIDLVRAWRLNVGIYFVHQRHWSELASSTLDLNLPIDLHVSLLELDNTGSVLELSEQEHSCVVTWVLMKEAWYLFLFVLNASGNTWIDVLVVPLDGIVSAVYLEHLHGVFHDKGGIVI